MQQESKILLIITTFTLLIMVVLLVVIYSIFIQKKTELLISQQEKELEFDKELSESLNEMKEQTLKNIGLELHDNLGQKLSVVRLKSNQLITKLKDDPKAELEEISAIVGECIQDIRNLSKTLNISDLSNFDLEYLIQIEFKRFEKLDHISFEGIMEIEDHEFHINPKHSLIIFRMIQETLNNIYKHSHAEEVYVKIWEGNKNYNFLIQDNGVGFDTQQKFNGKGLSNLRDRAKMINAEYELYSELNNGTKTKIKYPKYEHS